MPCGQPKSLNTNYRCHIMEWSVMKNNDLNISAMGSKIKFQVLKTLDERIKNFISGDIDTCYEHVSKAYIIGFINGNTINYIGLTQNLNGRMPGLELIGLAYFKSKPSNDEIKSDLTTIITFLEDTSQKDSLGLLPEMLNSITNSFIVYQSDESASTGLSRIIWTKDGALDKQPKISVMESNKIYAHSALSRIDISLKLDVSGEKSTSLEHVTRCFENGSKQFQFVLKDSKYSTNSMEDKSISDSLYDHLVAPDDIVSDDILSQMATSKKEKEAAIKKLSDKWRNKLKERRTPLVFEVWADTFSQQQDGIEVNLNIYHYIHMNDLMSTTLRKILSVIAHHVNLLETAIGVMGTAKVTDPNEVVICAFKPNCLDHLVYNVYVIQKDQPDYDKLKESRRSLHETYLAPMIPLFRVSQRILNLEMKNADEQKGYLCNVHGDIASKSGINAGLRNIIDGSYTYHHYMQNGMSDSGWGCAYRSLQTIISWFKHQGYICSPDVKPYNKNDKMESLRNTLNVEGRVPTHEEIQTILVDIGDKTQDFIGSKKWIGSQEVCFVLDHLYGISSKFIAVSSGSDLVNKARELGAHFKEQSTPVMVGGGVLAHTIIGTDFNEKNGDISYLILDPHYTDEESLDKILKKGWCGWKKNSFWDKTAFYNLCLPQRPEGI